MPEERSFLDKMFDHADSLVGVLEKGKELSGDNEEDERKEKHPDVIDADFEEVPTPIERKTSVPGVYRDGERIQHLRVDFYGAVATMRTDEERAQLRDLVDELKRLLG